AHSRIRSRHGRFGAPRIGERIIEVERVSVSRQRGFESASDIQLAIDDSWSREVSNLRQGGLGAPAIVLWIIHEHCVGRASTDDIKLSIQCCARRYPSR